MKVKHSNLIIVSLFILFFRPLPLQSENRFSPWPMQGYQILSGSFNGWSDRFFAIKDKSVYSVVIGPEGFAEEKITSLTVNPEQAKHFQMADVNVLVIWSNSGKSLEMIILDLSNKIVLKDKFKLYDDVHDLDLRFGQGRRPAFLFIKKSKEETKVILRFDEREQVIFLQNISVEALNLLWSELSAYIVTRDGTRPVVKLWQKGMTFSMDLPFIPVKSEFTQHGGLLNLLAIDSKSNLWNFTIRNRKLEGRIIYKNPELAYVREIFTARDTDAYNLILIGPERKKVIVLQFADPQFLNMNKNPGIFSLMDEGRVVPGSIRGKLHWIESNISGASYIFSLENAYSPLKEVNWNVSLDKGYPEVYFRWKSFPENKKFSYRYIMDTNPVSPPLPEYRVENNNLKITLSGDGDYFLHIQAKEDESGWESPVYHIPIFWKYKPEMPEIYLKNEVSPYVIAGKSIEFVIKNNKPQIYYAEVNPIPVYDPVKPVNIEGGEVQIQQALKPGRYYIHIRSKDPKTEKFSETLHYLFFYETYMTEYTVGTAEYNRDIGRLNMLIEKYKNAQGITEKEAILKELEDLKKEIEGEIAR